MTDPDARSPEFLEIFHKAVAKAQNASLANPTVAGLVKSHHDWPGVISKRFGESREVQMPDHFFDLEGALPETLTLRFVRPRIFDALSDAQLQARLNATGS